MGEGSGLVTLFGVLFAVCLLTLPSTAVLATFMRDDGRLSYLSRWGILAGTLAPVVLVLIFLAPLGLFWGFLGIIPACIAKSKGHPFVFPWFPLGVFAWPLGLWLAIQLEPAYA